MFQMERFHFNMRCRTKDHLIKDHNQCDSDYYISYESKIDICHRVNCKKNGHKDDFNYNFNQLRVTFLFLCLKWLF